MGRPRKSLKAMVDLYKRLRTEFKPEDVERVKWIITDELGGKRLTIPDADVLNRGERNDKIRTAYDLGAKPRELAKLHRLSVGQVKNILGTLPLFGPDDFL